MNINKSTVTKRQMEVLEAVYHHGNPWLKKVGPREAPQFISIGTISHAGGAVDRMLGELRRRGYITTESIPSQLTAKGLKKLGEDKQAMLAISPAELQGRITKRERIETETEEKREADRKQREEARAAADAASRKERVAKLRDLLGETEVSKELSDAMDDDQLLEFAGKVADIEMLY